MNIKNNLLNTDSYKLSHFLQSPKNVTSASAYLEPRKNFGAISDIVFFGLQAFLNNKPFDFTLKDVEEAATLAEKHGVPFNKSGFVEMFHDCKGTFPIQIDALHEGSVVKPKIPMLRVTNTNEKYAWIVGYVETMILRAVWYPSTVASLSRGIMRNIFVPNWNETSDAPIESLNHRLHDFAGRSVSSFESAGIGGMAHLLTFDGTDTLSGILFAIEHYGSDVCGHSVPASEHSQTVLWGAGDGEIEFIRNHIRNNKGKAVIASVMDTYDQHNMIDNIIGKTLKDEIIEFGGTFVCRLDSGNPSDEVIYTLKSLWESYGGTVNSKGYKVLHPSVRVLQGDGVNYNSIMQILDRMKQEKFSIDNIGFGMGSKLLQGVGRDDYGFAYKVSHAVVDGVSVDVFKQPIGDKSKTSKKGIVYVDSNFEYTPVKPDVDMLKTVYKNGVLVKSVSFSDIKSALASFD